MRYALLIAAFAGSAHAGCPADFDGFLRKFEADARFRLATVRFPLMYVEPNRGHELYPDAAPMTRWLSRKEISSARIPDPALPVVRKVIRKAAVRHVLYNLPESDAYSFELRFVRRADCWQLVRAEDLSL